MKYELVADYLRANQVTIDSFWEDQVVESKHYQMMCNEKTAGYFSVHNSSTIVLFNVFPKYANLSQALFERAKKYESITKAMVVTGDEFFLSHCIDNFSRIEKQAYFSIYTDKELPKVREMPLRLRLADIDKDKELLELSGDFLDGEIENIRNGLNFIEIYIVEFDNNIVGFGVVEYGRILENIASIGMYVCENYRCQGIATNILQSLKHIVQKNGFNALTSPSALLMR